MKIRVHWWAVQMALRADWTYIFASPTVLGSSMSPGQMARPTYYYIRSFQNEFLCECGGKSATVYTDNNLEIGTIEEANQQVFAVATVSISIPGIGSMATRVAIEVAQRIFGSLSSAIGWLEPDAVKARGESLLGDPSIVEMQAEPAPTAVCGDHIRMSTGVEEDWPEQGEPVPPPSPEEERAWALIIGLRDMRGELMDDLRRWLEQILEMLESRDERVRERGRRQLESLGRVIDRLLEITRETEHEAESVNEDAEAAGGGGN